MALTNIVFDTKTHGMVFLPSNRGNVAIIEHIVFATSLMLNIPTPSGGGGGTPIYSYVF